MNLRSVRGENRIFKIGISSVLVVKSDSSGQNCLEIKTLSNFVLALKEFSCALKSRKPKRAEIDPTYFFSVVLMLSRST